MKKTQNKKPVILKDVANILGEGHSSEIIAGRYFVHLYNEAFNTYACRGNFEVENILKYLFKKYQLNDSHYLQKAFSAESDIKKINYDASMFLIRIKNKLLLKYEYGGFRFYFGNEIKMVEMQEILDVLEKFNADQNFNSKFYMTVRFQGDFDLREFKIAPITVDLVNNYNDDFLKAHETIFAFLKDEKRNGLVLLHGKYGTGKTSYIRHLISTINKRVIYLPIELMNVITDPSFLPFISEYKNSVLIIEDCEELLRPRESENNKDNGIVNLLNLGDGLLADALGIKIICTFNANLKQIDQAILRKGRLVARYEFKELNKEKTQVLSDKIGFNTKMDGGHTLADIYNQAAADYKLNGTRSEVGFKTTSKN